MISSYQYFHIARFVLEAQTAVSINSGISDGAFDTLIVKDANNLPAIPSTSLAGVLRHRVRDTLPDDDTETIKRIFGFAEEDKTAASRLQISWGSIHNSRNKPVEGLILDEKAIKDDKLLSFLCQDHAMHRERVRINKKGVAQNTGKFDVTIIPTGCRFSFEISYWSDVEGEHDDDWKRILTLIQSPLYIGSSTRSGLGLFKCVEIQQTSFNLGDKDKEESYKIDFERYQKLGFALDDYSQLEAPKINKEQQNETNDQEDKIIQATIRLEAEDFWRFGHAGESLKPSKKSPDTTTLVEPVIDWSGGVGNFSPRHIIIPGSSIKGALNHRVQFHLNRLLDRYIDAKDDDGNNKKHIAPINLLFGTERNDKDGEESGQAGLIIISDMHFQYDPKKHQPVHLTHNSLDRYTGGVRDKVLYTEELIWQQDNPFDLKITIDEARYRLIEKQQIQSNTDSTETVVPLEKYKKALELTLDDLVEGRLALGAGSSKGHGYFGGTISWSNAGKRWLKQNISEMHEQGEEA